MRLMGREIRYSRERKVKMKTIVWGEPEIKPAEFLFLANTEAYNLEIFSVLSL